MFFDFDYHFFSSCLVLAAGNKKTFLFRKVWFVPN